MKSNCWSEGTRWTGKTSATSYQKGRDNGGRCFFCSKTWCPLPKSLQIGETCTDLRPPPWTTLGRAPRLRWWVIAPLNLSKLSASSLAIIFFLKRHDQALDQRIHYGAARHGPRLCTVVNGGVVVTEACPHHHARHEIQTKYEAPFPMWPGAVRHKQPPFLTLW